MSPDMAQKPWSVYINSDQQRGYGLRKWVDTEIRDINRLVALGSHGNTLDFSSGYCCCLV